jgi:DNA-binding response OmpR family regulator
MTTAPRRTVLVIEDDPTLRELLEEILSDEGYAVIQAGPGKDALCLAQERQPNVILLDGVVFGTSGPEIIRGLRAGATPRHIPVVMMSGRFLSGQDERLPDILLGKPFDLEVLLTHVNRMAALVETP